MIKNILVFSFSFIGDAVLSTAVIEPLRRHFPGANISFLVGVQASGILSGDPTIDHVLVYDNGGRHRGWQGKLHLIRLLRSKRFDLVVDLRDSFWSRFVGAEHWGMALRGGGEVHAVRRYLDVLQRRGVDIVGARPELQFTDEEFAERERFLVENRIWRDRLVVGIHPGGNWRYKLWGAKKFAQLANRISNRWNAHILVFAGPDEYALQSEVAGFLDLSSILVKNRGLRGVAALIERCDFYLGNDTGPMHISDAVGTPVVAIFGATNHRRSGPYGEEHIVVQGDLNLDCSPCHPGKHPGGCRAGSCAVIEAVAVEQVLDALEKMKAA